MASKLYIHAGNHKTGTTSIQALLHESRVKLAEAGRFVFSEDRHGCEARGNLTWGFDHSKLASEGASIKHQLLTRLVDFSAMGKRSVVFSSECFSWIFNKAQVETLKRHITPYFDEICVIFYVRRQDAHALSHFQQRFRSHAERVFFGEGFGPLPPLDENARKYLDYATRIGTWGDVFGDRSIRVIPFQGAIASGGLFSSFLSEIGVSSLHFSTPARNKAWGMTKAYVAYRMLQLGLEPCSPEGRKILSHCRDDSKALPSRDEARKFYAEFIDGNAALNRRFRVSDVPTIFFEDFELYPEVPRSPKSEGELESVVDSLVLACNSLCRGS